MNQLIAVLAALTTGLVVLVIVYFGGLWGTVAAFFAVMAFHVYYRYTRGFWYDEID